MYTEANDGTVTYKIDSHDKDRISTVQVSNYSHIKSKTVALDMRVATIRKEK